MPPWKSNQRRASAAAVPGLRQRLLARHGAAVESPGVDEGAKVDKGLALNAVDRTPAAKVLRSDGKSKPAMVKRGHRKGECGWSVECANGS